MKKSFLNENNVEIMTTNISTIPVGPEIIIVNGW